MKHFKDPAQRIGWLFVLATAAGVLSVLVMSSTLGAEDLLASVYANQSSVVFGQMLVFLMLTAMVGTAVLLYPVLKKHDPTLALGYVLARSLEVVIIAIGVVAGLLLLPLSWDNMAAEGANLAGAGVLAESLKASSDWTGYLGAQIIFSLSALVLNLAFYRNKLIPQWLSLWGLIGVPLMFLSGFLVMFESLNSGASTLNLLVVPLALQEMVMAIWMIAKGFTVTGDKKPKMKAIDRTAVQV